MEIEFEVPTGEFKPDLLNPLVWAYIGDAVYELYIRTRLVAKGPCKIHQLHSESVKYVRSSAQAAFVKRIAEILTEEEMLIVKKGRNTKSTVPKNALVSDYRYSTGLESLLGYLFLHNKKERLTEILEQIDFNRVHEQP